MGHEKRRGLLQVDFNEMPTLNSNKETNIAILHFTEINGFN